MGDFARCLAVELKEEGGNDNDPLDPGGRTSRGIIQQPEYDAWCDKHGLPRGDVWKASDASIVAIYHENYWIRIHGDALPSGVDATLMDCSVHNGVSQTALWVQRSLGIKADGDFGPQTFAAIAANRDNVALIASILDKRLTMEKAIKLKNGQSAWSRYGKDWGGRIARVKETATSWAAQGVQGDNHPDVEFSAPRARPDGLKPPAIPQEAPHTLTFLGTIGAAGAGALHEFSGTATQIADALRPATEILPVIGTICVCLGVAGAIAGIIVGIQHRRHQALVDGSAGG